ncbi:MAG: gamma-glutamyltransferase [Candidatus Krumholzibacteriia bacterium]
MRSTSLDGAILATVLLATMAYPRQASAVESPAAAEHGMVVSAHPAASRAGVGILRQGGNAVDAAIATALALAVCEPYSSGLGGGGFLVCFDAGTGRVSALDARETAPAAAHRDMFVRGGAPVDSLSRDGALSVGVPGLARGLWEAHRAQGRLPWAQLVQPAVVLARGGIPVSQMLAERIAEERHRFNPAARAVFLPGGGVPQIGTILVQEDLAATLEAIALDGPDAFYRGPVAAAIAAVTAPGGRGITLDDLAGYQAVWREPIHGRYRGCDVWSMPPPSSGGVHLVQMLNVLEGFDLEGAGFGSAAAVHPMTEAMKFAFADRSRFLGDPDFVPVPVARLTGPAYADSLRSLIRPDRAIPAAAIDGATLVHPESAHTTHLSVVDADGDAVAATLTINLSFGSGWMAAGTGVMLNDEMDDFVAAPGFANAFGLVGGEANSAAPGKRPLSSMTPTIVLQDGRVKMVTGAPGGSRIITTTLQTIVNVLDHGMDALQAVSAPRIHHQWSPDLLFFEAHGLSPDTQRILEGLGHRLEERTPMCNAQIIVADPETGLLTGASDPRGMGAAEGF